MDKEKNKIIIPEIPELVRKQLKLLGLFFGTWALFLGNMLMLNQIIKTFKTFQITFMPYTFEHMNNFRNVAFIIISVFTILQMCAIYKYILKK